MFTESIPNISKTCFRKYQQHFTRILPFQEFYFQNTRPSLFIKWNKLNMIIRDFLSLNIFKIALIQDEKKQFGMHSYPQRSQQYLTRLRIGVSHPPSRKFQLTSNLQMLLLFFVVVVQKSFKISVPLAPLVLLMPENYLTQQYSIVQFLSEPKIFVQILPQVLKIPWSL